MPSLRVAVCLLACACAAFAFQCYSGQTTSNNHPSSTTDCTGSYCTKIAVKTDSETTYNYGCDMTKVCAKEGCYSGVSGAQVCCCGSNLCNSSTKLSGLFALAPIALIKILAF